jgi:hypothetical protein
MLRFLTDLNGHSLVIEEYNKSHLKSDEAVAGLEASCKTCKTKIGDYGMVGYPKYRLALVQAKQDAVSHAGTDVDKPVWLPVDSR